MSEIHLALTETTIDGSGSRLWSLSRDDFAELAMHRIKQLGLADAPRPTAGCGCGRPAVL